MKTLHESIYYLIKTKLDEAKLNNVVGGITSFDSDQEADEFHSGIERNLRASGHKPDVNSTPEQQIWKHTKTNETTTINRQEVKNGGKGSGNIKYIVGVKHG